MAGCAGQDQFILQPATDEHDIGPLQIGDGFEVIAFGGIEIDVKGIRRGNQLARRRRIRIEAVDLRFRHLHCRR